MQKENIFSGYFRAVQLMTGFLHYFYRTFCPDRMAGFATVRVARDSCHETQKKNSKFSPGNKRDALGSAAEGHHRQAFKPFFYSSFKSNIFHWSLYLSIVLFCLLRNI